MSLRSDRDLSGEFEKKNPKPSKKPQVIEDHEDFVDETPASNKKRTWTTTEHENPRHDLEGK